MVGNFNVVAEKMEERFDYVTLIGVLEYAKAILERIIRIRNIWKDQSSLKTGRKNPDCD